MDSLNDLEKYFSQETEEIYNFFNWNEIQKFYEFLKEKNEIGGFFSKNDSLNIWERHVIESVYHVYKITKVLSVSRETEILDVGTGPGLPGYIFCCLKETPKVTLLDSQKRKLKHLEEFLKERKDFKVKVEYERIEKYKKQYHLVVMRSVIPYPWNLEMVCHTVKMHGYFVPFLGKDFEDKNLEKEKLEKYGFHLEETLQLEKLKFLGMRHIKFLKKKRNVDHSLQRDWSKIQQEIKNYHGKNSIH